MSLEPLAVHRLLFAFTATYHYIFPQFSMGLALLLMVMKTLALRKNDEIWDSAARFSGKIFAISFLMGVVTGIPMEFQFGTNWAAFSKAAGGVIGQTLAMEGTFAFFLESSFIGLFLFGEKRLGPKGHWFAAFMVFLGAWLSGWFIIATNAWMQRPVGYRLGKNGEILLESFWSLLINHWAFWEYVHNMSGAVITGSFALTALGAFYLLRGRDVEHAKRFVRVGVIAGVIASLFQLVPSGHAQAMLVAKHQPATLAAMDGLFDTQRGAPLSIAGMPNVAEERLDCAIRIPKMLSLLAEMDPNAEVKGLKDFPRDAWPDQIPLLFQAYHAMIGLGMFFIGLMLLSAWMLKTGKLFETKWLLWVLEAAFPLPFVANTMGWMTAELGRQPWLIYGLMKTAGGSSPMVSAGAGFFSLIGFAAIYALLSVLVVFLIAREIQHGPSGGERHAH